MTSAFAPDCGHDRLRSGRDDVSRRGVRLDRRVTGLRRADVHPRQVGRPSPAMDLYITLVLRIARRPLFFAKDNP
jgi:hypothetical protein